MVPPVLAVLSPVDYGVLLLYLGAMVAVGLYFSGRQRSTGELLFAGRQPFYQIDNMEGIAVHTAGDELRITVLSDDNYNRDVQRTVMFQFALRR